MKITYYILCIDPVDQDVDIIKKEVKGEDEYDTHEEVCHFIDIELDNYQYVNLPLKKEVMDKLLECYDKLKKAPNKKNKPRN